MFILDKLVCSYVIVIHLNQQPNLRFNIEWLCLVWWNRMGIKIEMKWNEKDNDLFHSLVWLWFWNHTFTGKIHYIFDPFC